MRTLVGDSAQPEPGALLRRLRSRRRGGREVSEGCRKSASPSGLRGAVERTPIPRTLVRRTSQDLRSLREIWGAHLPLRTPFLWAEELESHCPGMTREGRKRKDRGDRIGRGIWGGFLKGSYNLGISPLTRRQVMPGPEIFCYLTVQPRNEEVNDKCSLLGREGWKTRARVLLGGSWVWITLLQSYSFFAFHFATPSPETVFPISFCVWFQWG